MRGLYSQEHKYLSGREVIENFPHASRPFIAVNDDNIEKVKEAVLENRRVGIREKKEDLNIPYGSTQHILVNILCIRRVKARFLNDLET